MLVVGFILQKYNELVKCAAEKVLYLLWFLWGRLICEDAAEIVMMGEC